MNTAHPKMLVFSVLLLATSALAGVIPANLDSEEIILEQQPSDHQPVYHQQQSIGSGRQVAGNHVQQPFDQNVFFAQTKNAQPTVKPQPFVQLNSDAIDIHHSIGSAQYNQPRNTGFNRNSAPKSINTVPFHHTQPKSQTVVQQHHQQHPAAVVESRHHVPGHNFVGVVPKEGVTHQRIVSDDSSSHARIVQQDMEVNPDGSFFNVWGSDNGIKVEEQGTIKRVGDVDVSVQQGQISYVDNEGKTYYLRYVADENGFHVQGDHLPTPPPIPAAIARGLEFIAAHPYVETTTFTPQGQYQLGQTGQLPVVIDN